MNFGAIADNFRTFAQLVFAHHLSENSGRKGFEDVSLSSITSPKGHPDAFDCEVEDGSYL